MDNEGDAQVDEAGESDPDMGYTFGQGYAVNANAPQGTFKPVVVFGNGYGSGRGNAVLYILDAGSGVLLRKIDTGIGEDNGLSVPAVVDVNLDRCVDYVYAGDLRGNLWKFDLRDADPRRWGSAYGEDLDGDGVIDAADGDVPRPLFQAMGQSITGRPDVMAMSGACNPRAPGYMVIFGTGKLLEKRDLNDLRQQTIYGIWDFGDDGDDSEIVGYLADRDSGRLSTGLFLARRRVISQSDPQGTLRRRLSDGYGGEFPTIQDTIDGDGISRNNEGTTQWENPAEIAGWFFDFPVSPASEAEPGERVTANVIIRGGKVLVVSFAPSNLPCRGEGGSWVYLLDGCGASEQVPEQIDSARWPRRYEGHLNEHITVIKDARAPELDQIVMSDGSGRMIRQEIAGERWGRVFWRQKMRD